MRKKTPVENNIVDGCRERLRVRRCCHNERRESRLSLEVWQPGCQVEARTSETNLKPNLKPKSILHTQNRLRAHICPTDHHGASICAQTTHALQITMEKVFVCVLQIIMEQTYTDRLCPTDHNRARSVRDLICQMCVKLQHRCKECRR